MQNPHHGRSHHQHSSARNDQKQKEKTAPKNAFQLEKDYTPDWVSQALTQDAIDHAHHLGHFLAEEKMTNTQIRNFFSELRRIEAKGVENANNDIIALQPKMAYVTERLKKEAKVPDAAAEAFYNIIYKGLREICPGKPQATERFARFVAYFEAILAYHRFHGGQ